MDCCKNKSEMKENNKMKGGKMDKKTLLWVIIVILIVAVLFVSMKSPGSTVQAASSAGQAVSSGGSAMVGGC